jgi:hypothetical protein
MLPSKASLNRALLHVVNEAMVHAVTAHSFLTRNRMSHLFGTCGRGTLRVVDRPAFPRNEFFEPGRVFPCRLRHAAATFDDDAWLLVRSASIKLADTDYDAPLDIEMNTGQTALFSNTVQFVDFGRLSTGERIQRDGWYYRKYPLAWEGVKTGVRRTPRSYSLLHYYTQTCSRFVGLDGIERSMKLRLLPESREPDHGFPTAWDFARPINQHRLPDETRSPTFLRDEWEALEEHARLVVRCSFAREHVDARLGGERLEAALTRQRSFGSRAHERCCARPGDHGHRVPEESKAKDGADLLRAVREELERGLAERVRVADQR